jgi:hypothetical protein
MKLVLEESLKEPNPLKLKQKRERPAVSNDFSFVWIFEGFLLIKFGISYLQNAEYFVLCLLFIV